MFGHWIVFYDLYCTVLYWVHLSVDISNVGMCMVWVTQNLHHMKLVIMCFSDVNQGGSNRLDMYTVDVGLRNASAR